MLPARSLRLARQGLTTSFRPLVNPRSFHSTPASLAVQVVKSVQEFKQIVSKEDKVLVDCFATWCGPCKAIAPVLERHSDEPEFSGKIHFVKFDVEELPQLTQELGVRAMPTFVFFKGGKKVDELIGANPPVLLQLLRKHNA